MRENDIVFFNLHRRYINMEPQFGGFMGIYLLSAFLNNNGYNAQGYAGAFMRGKDILDKICQNKQVEVIGLYCDYDNVTENIFLSRYIKEMYGLPVIVGGPQATALKQDFYEKSLCDAVVRFEGELTVLDLMNVLLDCTKAIEDVAGISYIRDGRLIINPERQLIENLDMLPLVTAEEYIEPSHYGRSLSLMTGRGCPFHCAFCHEGHHTKKVRLKSVQRVLEELEHYLDYYPNKNDIHILFVDDTFTLIPERVKAICEGIKRLCANRDVRWFSEGHIHTLYKNQEMIEYIANSGGYRLQLGIEAGTQKVLDAYRKGSTLEEIRTVIIKCKEAGIKEVFSNIILGGAHFSREIYYQDKEFAKELLTLGEGIVEIGVVTYWPLPETSVTDCPSEYGIKIIDKEFTTSAGDFPQVECGDLTRSDIMQMQQEMFQELLEHMKNMLLHGNVPHERIISWMDSYKIKTGAWYRVLKTIPHVLAFYQMLASGEAERLERAVQINTIEKLHPMRTIALFNTVKIKSNGDIEICENTVSQREFEILTYSIGKLSISEISQKVNIEIDEIIIYLKRLERIFLVVFSPY